MKARTTQMWKEGRLGRSKLNRRNMRRKWRRMTNWSLQWADLANGSTGFEGLPAKSGVQFPMIWSSLQAIRSQWLSPRNIHRGRHCRHDSNYIRIRPLDLSTQLKRFRWLIWLYSSDVCFITQLIRFPCSGLLLEVTYVAEERSTATCSPWSGG